MFQLKERENLITVLKAEVEATQVKLRQTKEELAERDGQLRVAKLNLTTAQKHSEHHSQEVHRYEESISQLQGDLDKSQEQYRLCHTEVRYQIPEISNEFKVF